MNESSTGDSNSCSRRAVDALADVQASHKEELNLNPSQGLLSF